MYDSTNEKYNKRLFFFVSNSNFEKHLNRITVAAK